MKKPTVTMTSDACAQAGVLQAHVREENLPDDTRTLRDIFRKMMSDAPLSPRAFNEACTRILDLKVQGGHQKASPRQWVKAGLRVKTRCGKCDGTGTYGKPESPVGPCYACNGKGHQTHDDWVRNCNYWEMRSQAD